MLRTLERIALYALVAASATGFAQTPVAATPPMGWNSWDSYGLTVTETQFRNNVSVLASTLRPYGWNYAVIDEGWYFFNPEVRYSDTKNLHYALDRYGRYVPVPARFPSAGAASAAADSPGTIPVTFEKTSLAALGQWVHAQGLKFGIHIVRGISRAATERNLPIEGSDFHAQDAADTTETCPWDPTNYGVKDNAAGQAFYDSLIRQYAGWGVDFLKVDCIADRPYRESEIRQIHRAIEKTGRPMVLSLSPGPAALAHATQFAELSNMWRISDDVWDVWARSGNDSFPQTVTSQFARFNAWSPYAKPGNWPDGDMLAFGRLAPQPGLGAARTSRLSLEEERTQLTLWAMARSPLILGANLTELDSPLTKLITNRDLIRINQTALRSRQAMQDGDLIAWFAELPKGEKALALFNVGDMPTAVAKPLSAFDPSLQGRDWKMRNVWQAKAASRGSSVSETIPPHGSVLLLLK